MKKKKNSQFSRDSARFPVFTVRTMLKICWCVVCCLRHIAGHHTTGAKQFNLGFFFVLVCGLSHFEDLIRLYKYFTVYPAWAFQSFVVLIKCFQRRQEKCLKFFLSYQELTGDSWIHALKIEMQMICDSFSLVFWPLRGAVTLLVILLALSGWIVLNTWFSCRWLISWSDQWGWNLQWFYKAHFIQTHELIYAAFKINILNLNVQM